VTNDEILRPLLDAYLDSQPRAVYRKGVKLPDRHAAGEQLARAMLDTGLREYRGYRAERVYAGMVPGKEAEAGAWLAANKLTEFREELADRVKEGLALPEELFRVRVRLVAPGL
jgi:hypothetical protein